MSANSLLSAIDVLFGSGEFTGALQPYISDEAFSALRERADVLVYRHRGRPSDSQVLVVPTMAPPGDETFRFGPLPVRANLRAIARFVEDRLARL